MKRRNDIILVIIVILVACISLLCMKLLNKQQQLIAYVYYKDELVHVIHLYELNEEIVVYTIEGENGEVVIEAKHNAIRVEKENSPYHLCSKQGFSSSTSEPIICLPNKVYIKLVGNQSDLDLEI